MKKRILITGANGFIGKNLKESLCSAYDCYTPNRQQLELLDHVTVKKYLAETRIDIVIHAANTNHVVHPEDLNNILDYNLRMFFNLYRCSSMYSKMIYFGSGAEYAPDNYDFGICETMLGKNIPVDSYGLSKYIMAEAAEKSNNIYDLCLFGVFGKYEEWNRRFISNVLYQALYEKNIIMERHKYLDYIYIQDLIDLIHRFIDTEPPHHRYNVCSGKRQDLYDIAKIVLKKAGSEKDIVLKDNNWNPTYMGNNNRLKQLFPEFRFTPIETGISKLINFYQSEGFN